MAAKIDKERVIEVVSDPRALALEVVGLAFLAWKLKNQHQMRNQQNSEPELDRDPPLSEFQDDGTVVQVNTDQKGSASSLSVTLLEPSGGGALVSASDPNTSDRFNPDFKLEDEGLSWDNEKLTVLRDKLAGLVEKWQKKLSGGEE